MNVFYRLVFLLSVLLAGPAIAATNTYEFSSPDEEERFKQLTEELRCLVCQNQSLADSNAGLADDLRNEVYDMVREGGDKGEIVDFLVQRYGDFVLYRPPVKSSTAFLWFGPFLFLLVAGILVLRFVRNRPKKVAELEFSEADKQRVAEALRAAEQEKGAR